MRRLLGPQRYPNRRDTGDAADGSSGAGTAFLVYGSIIGGLFLLANLFAGPDTRGMSRKEKIRRGYYD